MFTHVDVWHIALNMMALFILGPALERIIGRVRFLMVYLVGGLGGSVLVLFLSSATSSTLGASGAIYAVLGALLVTFRKARLDTQFLMQNLLLGVVITVVGWSYISWQGHLGGLLAGMARRRDRGVRPEVEPLAPPVGGSRRPDDRPARPRRRARDGARLNLAPPHRPRTSSYDVVAGAFSFPTGVHTAVDNYSDVILHRCFPQCGEPIACSVLATGATASRTSRRTTPKSTRAVRETPSLPQEGASLTARGAGPDHHTGSSGRGRTYSHLVAKLNPTAMNAMPTTRFHWPRSLKTHSLERSSEKT